MIELDFLAVLAQWPALLKGAVIGRVSKRTARLSRELAAMTSRARFMSPATVIAVTTSMRVLRSRPRRCGSVVVT